MAVFLSIEYPQNGWLPIRVKFDEFQVETVASNVLNDPVIELIDVLRLCWSTSGGTERVVLWEEPFAWIVDFGCDANESGCRIRVSSCRHWSGPDSGSEIAHKFETLIDRALVAKAIASTVNSWLRRIHEKDRVEWNPERNHAEAFSRYQKLRGS